MLCHKYRTGFIIYFECFFLVKESGLILLQTMPGRIDIEVFKTDLLAQFKDIVSVHDIHIWQLTANKVVSTAHIIFQNTHVSGTQKNHTKSIAPFRLIAF